MKKPRPSQDVGLGLPRVLTPGGNCISASEPRHPHVPIARARNGRARASGKEPFRIRSQPNRPGLGGRYQPRGARRDRRSRFRVGRRKISSGDSPAARDSCSGWDGGLPRGGFTVDAQREPKRDAHFGELRGGGRGNGRLIRLRWAMERRLLSMYRRRAHLAPMISE